MENDTTTLEKRMAVSWKVKYLLCDIPFHSGIYTRKKKVLCPYKDLHMNVHSCSAPSFKQLQWCPPTDEWMNRQTNYSVIKTDELLRHATWKNLKIMLSDRNHII